MIDRSRAAFREYSPSGQLKFLEALRRGEKRGKEREEFGGEWVAPGQCLFLVG